MGYQKTADDEDENLSISTDLPGDNELSFEQDREESEFTSDDEIDPISLDSDAITSSKKSKSQPKTFSLQARRAIEDILEEREFRKKIDYLYDDDFSKPE